MKRELEEAEEEAVREVRRRFADGWGRFAQPPGGRRASPHTSCSDFAPSHLSPEQSSIYERHAAQFDSRNPWSATTEGASLPEMWLSETAGARVEGLPSEEHVDSLLGHNLCARCQEGALRRDPHQHWSLDPAMGGAPVGEDDFEGETSRMRELVWAEAWKNAFEMLSEGCQDEIERGVRDGMRRASRRLFQLQALVGCGQLRW